MKNKPIIEKGTSVTYVPKHGKREVGIVKSIAGNYAFVVYRCADNWAYYEDYTATRTLISDLIIGWHS